MLNAINIARDAWRLIQSDNGIFEQSNSLSLSLISNLINANTPFSTNRINTILSEQTTHDKREQKANTKKIHAS